MKSHRNLIYFFGLLLSLLFIGLYFIDTSCTWCSISNSVGTSLLSAIILGWILEQQSKFYTKTQNKNTFQVLNSDILEEIIKLLTVMNRVVVDLYEDLQFKGVFSFENENIMELVKTFIAAITEIENGTAPVIASNDVVSPESLEYDRLSNKVKLALKKSDDEFAKFRLEFDDLKFKFEIRKDSLLVNDNSFKKMVCELFTILDVLGTQKSNTLSKKEKLFEYGESLKELADCNVFDALWAIGFDQLVFSNKNNYFECKNLKENNHEIQI